MHLNYMKQPDPSYICAWQRLVFPKQRGQRRPVNQNYLSKLPVSARSTAGRAAHVHCRALRRGIPLAVEHQTGTGWKRVTTYYSKVPNPLAASLS